MSTQIANNSLAGAVVGTTGKINVGQATPPPTIEQQMRPLQVAGSTLVVFNESGCGLTCTFPTSRESFTLPAGAWRQIQVPPAEVELDYVVSYVLPNAPVSQLFADLYLPGEQIDPVSTLGNSPIGGGVPLSVSQVINDSNPTPTIVLETTPLGGTFSAAKITNDGKETIGTVTVIDEVSGATGLILASAASGADGVIASRQSGAATGGVLQSWDGAAAAIPFSWGGQFATAKTWLDSLGQVGAVGGIATTGVKRGIPIEIARGDDVHVTSTTQVTVCSVTVPNESPNPVCRFSADFLIPLSNTNNGVITLQVSYTDPYSGAATTQTFFMPDIGGLLLGSAVARGAGDRYTTAIRVKVKPNTTASITYANTAAGTIGDFVSGIIELL